MSPRSLLQKRAHYLTEFFFQHLEFFNFPLEQHKQFLQDIINVDPVFRAVAEQMEELNTAHISKTIEFRIR